MAVSDGHIHDKNCRCHRRDRHKCAEWIRVYHDHPYTDPRCEELRLEFINRLEHTLICKSCLDLLAETNL